MNKVTNMKHTSLIGRLGQTETYRGITIKADHVLHEQIAARVRELMPPPARILDFGAGEGALSLRLKDLGYDVHACDINDKDFKCKDSIEFLELDFNNKSEIDKFCNERQNKYDIVIGIEVIEHVENPWEYARNLQKMARKDGYIIITTPNITSWLSRLKFLMFGEFSSFSDVDYAGSGHINPISAWEMRIILGAIGLKDIVIRPAGYLPKIIFGRSWKMYVLNILHLILRPLMRGIRDGWCIMVTGRK